jgi:hypothetical protein
MYKIISNGFISDNNNFHRYLDFSNANCSEDWIKKQEASISEYEANDVQIPKNVEILYGLFNNYIACEISGREKLNILDVGCGISRSIPSYASSIKIGEQVTSNIYVGLDPLLINADERKYPFIAGRLEDLPKLFSSKFDVFLFSTSLDHFENLNDVVKSTLLLANKDAIVILWAGLHDSKLVGIPMGAKYISNLFASLNPLIYLINLFKILLLLVVNYFRMCKRELYLLQGKNLDQLHFHYFTKKNILPILELFGPIKRFIHVPGTNSIFATVIIKKKIN